MGLENILLVMLYHGIYAVVQNSKNIGVLTSLNSLNPFLHKNTSTDFTDKHRLILKAK